MKPCRHPGCPSLTAGRYCTEHEVASNKARGSAADRGYNNKWQKERHRFLKSNPLCLECKTNNKITAATVVDHIIPHRGDKQLMWDESNWQPLCKRCHDRKTATKDGGFGRGDINYKY